MVFVSALWYLSQHLPSYLGFSYLGHGISLHSCSSKAQSLLLTLDEGYLLTAAPPDLERGVAPLGPPVPVQPPLLGLGVAPLGHCPWPRAWGLSSQLLPWPWHVYHILRQLYVDGNFDCFRVLSLICSTTKNIGVHVLCWPKSSFRVFYTILWKDSGLSWWRRW